MQLLSVIIVASLLFPSCGKTHNTPLPKPPTVVQESVLPEGWYNHNQKELTQELDYYFQTAQQSFAIPADIRPTALIVPHAGYYYSGLCAATAYQALFDKNEAGKSPEKNTAIKRVIILSPAHKVFLNGVAVPVYTEYKTVFGTVPVDHQAMHTIKKDKRFQVMPEAHAHEHAIEMQLPFLQKTIADFTIVPLIVGHVNKNDLYQVATTLKEIIDPTTLVVVSSDFVHYGPDFSYTIFDSHLSDCVRRLDSLALRPIASHSVAGFCEALKKTGATVCGQEPIKVLLALQELGALPPLQVALTGYYTSAQMQLAREHSLIDTAKLYQDVPDKAAQSSVSYLGIALTPVATNAPLYARLTGYEKQSLLHFARHILENHFAPDDTKKEAVLLYPMLTPLLEAPLGTFVTLHTKDGQLRGCIGRVLAEEPLYFTIAQMAKAAAFADNRFSPLTEKELANVVIEISLLSRPQKIATVQDIVLGKHGIILYKYDKQNNVIGSSLFLPQVPLGQRWNLETTLEQLSLKAGFARDTWKEDCTFEVFEGIEFSEDKV